jgi:methylglutaconyl-CoA hydratase
MSQPDPGHVTLDVTHGVATIEFWHPKGNSLPGPLLQRLADRVDEAGARADAAVVVLRSAGSGPFCAGASFDELRAIDTPERGLEFFSGFARVILAMRRCPKFVITRVQGKVAGGGIGIVAASEYAIASEDAALRLSELAVGIGPFVVGPVIERRIGRAHFTAMAVDVEWRNAHWGERSGLFAQVVVPSALDDAVDTLARRLAAANPEAMTAMKRTFWEGTDDWATLLLERAAISGRLVLSDHTRRAIAAFAARA